MSKVSEIIKLIKKETHCYFVREGANHEIWYNPDTDVFFQIPRHRAKELPKGTENSILRSAGLR